ncbi:MAG: GxxExxY protein [Armatimonadota bacterium]|nr:GxxExxY protein [Armatimonadota bacterium]
MNEISEEIIGCCFKVSNTLGSGFLEKVYENALAHELRKCGRIVEQKKSVIVRYDGQIIGEYFADLLVDRCVLIELKAVDFLAESHTAQCLNYLRATELKLGLVVNFGRPKVEVKRVANHL